MLGTLALSLYVGMCSNFFTTKLNVYKRFDGLTLHWRADMGTETLYLGLEAPIDDSGASDAGGWVGVGIAEQSAGSMPGADILVVRQESSGQWIVEDRHALAFAAPVLDEIQDWKIDGATVDNGTLYATIHRKFDTQDGQDRPIVGGSMLILWARGQTHTFWKHKGTNRRVEGVRFYGDEDLGDWDKREDDTEFVYLSMQNFQIPKKRTTYACRSHMPLQLFNGEDAWLTRFDFINLNPKYNHHFIIHACDPANMGPNRQGGVWKQFEEKTMECQSPQGNYDEGCSSAVYIWAVGAQNWTLPPNVGYLVSDKQPHGIRAFVVEMHFDNPDLTEGIIDNSSVVVWFTRKKRKHDLGLLTVGDPLVSANPIPPRVPLQHYQFTCGSTCTSRWDHPITIIGSNLHMHVHGKRMVSILHKQDGTSTYINRAEYYNFDSQQTRMIKPLVVEPGDTLNLHCVFENPSDTAVSFNLGSNDEMCMEFLNYYPILKRPGDGIPINFCGFMKRFWEYPFLNGTICGVDLLEKNDADFSTCNPAPSEIDSDECWEATWGQSGTSGIPKPCVRVANPGFHCERTRHILTVEDDGTEVYRWTNALPPLDFNDGRLLPSGAVRTHVTALAVLGILLACV
eukprot:Hpha_TRINITY_DN16036_c3_g6::TRINITY_DN16036_c3_g6_i1::g.120620::m.120620